MKTSQLRLGNLIKIKKPILKDLIDEGFQKIYTDRTTVIYVGYDYLGVIIDNSEVEIMLQDIEPIPLTEEWLLKFENIPWISKDKSGVFYWFNGEKKYIKFVHTLQNTYFCIEQKELLCKDTETLNI